MAKIKVRVKKDSPAADIIKAAKEEKQQKMDGVLELRYKDGTPMRKYNSPKLQAIEMENKQTAVTWLINELIQNKLMALRYDSDNTFDEIYKKAKQMEQEQLENARPQIISNCVIKEIADDEIEKWVSSTGYYGHCIGEYREGLDEGAKWYREQLKKQ